jgi:peptidoglycan LD-endopeptidase CwlK
MQIEDMVRAVQAKLGVGVDGRAGPQTWGAIYKRIVDRSEKVIGRLHPRAQP